MTASADPGELRDRLEELEASTEEKIEDLRERVVQVKRETDEKAPAEHDHDQLAARLTALESDLESVQAALERTDDRLEGGFENFEEILETLLDRTDGLEGDVRTLGQALRGLRETLDTVAEREQRRARADHLKDTAAARGVRTAACEDCNTKVDVALLSDATCPSCGAAFHTLDANPGFFGRSVLETGERPALEGETASPQADLDALSDRESPDQSEWHEAESPEEDQ
ncbi:MAG: hypothetical protein ABEJ60_03285 [Halodesulfurarchaeum sp.]